MRALVSSIRLSVFLAVLVVLAGCAVNLLPSYDETGYRKYLTLNEEALTLFASLEAGSPQSKYTDYEPQYAKVIGGFDGALSVAATRPLPPGGRAILERGPLKEVCSKLRDSEACLNPTKAYLESVLDVLRNTRDAHKALGLDRSIVEAQARAYRDNMAYVLELEADLQR